MIIADRENNIIGRKSFGYRGKLSAKRAKALVDSVELLRGKKTNNQVLLLPRELTPWAWLEADRFELPAVDIEPGVKPNPSQGSGPKAANKGNEE